MVFQAGHTLHCFELSGWPRVQMMLDGGLTHISEYQVVNRLKKEMPAAFLGTNMVPRGRRTSVRQGTSNPARQGTSKAWTAQVKELDVDISKWVEPLTMEPEVFDPCRTWDSWNQCIPLPVRKLVNANMAWQGHPQRSGPLWHTAFNSRYT